MTKSKKCESAQNRKEIHFAEVNIFPDLARDYLQQTWNGLYEKPFEGIDKQYYNGLKK